MQRLASILAASAFAATASAQFTTVLPASATGVAGSTTNAFPWGTTASTFPGLRLMCLYDSTHFTAAPVPVTFPILINQIRWRANDVATTTSWVGGTYNNAQLSLGTAAVDHTLASTTWASNIGPDYTQVYSGPVTVVGGSGLGVGVPGPYVVTIPVSPPFLYDPSLGDLVVDTNYAVPAYTGGTLPGVDVHATNVLGRRVYSSTLWPNANGVDTACPVIEVGYVPAAGLYSAFSASATSGASPLSVTFSDLTYTSDPGGVTSWAWDFDGDSIIDSNLQNPTFNYASCGDYTVSLTTTDATHPPSTLTRTNFIRTDNVTPSFTFASIGPNTYQFTDTSTPAPTSWSWDLDGDSIVDSTLQNPVWAYTSPCSAPLITLSVSRLCKGPFLTQQALFVASPTSQSTVFTGGNGLSAPGSGNTFDIQVTNPSGINIFALTVAPYMATPVVGTPLQVTVWITAAPGGYLANHTNAAVWRQVATGAGIFAGGTFTAPVPVNISLSNPIYVPQGTFGMAVHITGGSGVAYTNVTAPFAYPGPDVTITAGNGKPTPFAATANAGRAWNGTLHYSLVSNCALAGYGFFGAGCPGTLGITRVQNTSLPKVGTTLSTNLNNLQFGIAVMVVGLSNTLSGGAIPLPLDLGILGAPGCPLRVSLDVTDTVVGAGTTATWNFNIPNNPLLIGFQLYNQAASLDTTNAFGFVTSDAYAWMVGN